MSDTNNPLKIVYVTPALHMASPTQNLIEPEKKEKICDIHIFFVILQPILSKIA